MLRITLNNSSSGSYLTFFTEDARREGKMKEKGAVSGTILHFVHRNAAVVVVEVDASFTTREGGGGGSVALKKWVRAAGPLPPAAHATPPTRAAALRKDESREQHCAREARQFAAAHIAQSRPPPCA